MLIRYQRSSQQQQGVYDLDVWGTDATDTRRASTSFPVFEGRPTKIGIDLECDGPYVSCSSVAPGGRSRPLPWEASLLLLALVGMARGVSPSASWRVVRPTTRLSRQKPNPRSGPGC